jgi:hypothetical protein
VGVAVHAAAAVVLVIWISFVSHALSELVARLSAWLAEPDEEGRAELLDQWVLWLDDMKPTERPVQAGSILWRGLRCAPRRAAAAAAARKRRPLFGRVKASDIVVVGALELGIRSTLADGEHVRVVCSLTGNVHLQDVQTGETTPVLLEEVGRRRPLTVNDPEHGRYIKNLSIDVRFLLGCPAAWPDPLILPADPYFT